MAEKILSKRAKKLVRWHNSYVVFVTPEVKDLKWKKQQNVKVSLVDSGGKKKIVVEKLDL